MRKLFYLLLFICCHITIYAQKENNIWYLGYPLALNFNGSAPVLQDMHAAVGFGGGASVCDASGELLFYTNGTGIFRKDHSLMPGTANYSNYKSAVGFIKSYSPNYPNDSLILVTSHFNTGVKIVQLDKTMPRFHLFYMNYHEGDSINSTVININKRLPFLAYSIVDMNLNGGLGGIDPNYKNVVVDSQLTNSFDIMSDGQCGVWIVVNKKNIAYEPKSVQEDQGHLLSYLLQPDGTIVLVHSQPEFYPLPIQDYSSGNYPHVGIHFSENKDFLILSHGARRSPPYGSYVNSFYAILFNNFTSVDIRSFNSRTGLSVSVMDSLLSIDSHFIQNQAHPNFEHNMYITDNNDWIYTYGFGITGMSMDTVLAYSGATLGNSLQMRQSVQKIDIKKILFSKLPSNLHIDSFKLNTSFSKFKKGPDGKLYFLCTIQKAWNYTLKNDHLIVVRIPDPSTIISADNFEVVAIAKFMDIETQYNNNFINNHLGQEFIRCSGTTHLNMYQNSDMIRFFFSHLTPQIGTNAIIYEPQEVATIVTDTIFCPGQSYYVQSPYPQYDNHWQPNNILSDSLLISEAGEYTLTTTAPHCTFNSVFKVTAVEESLSIPQNDTAICTQRPITLQAELKNISSMQWNTGSQETSITVNESGQYIASATGICGPLADTVTITASDCSCLHFVPNAFTPNNDGLNDQLYTYLHCEPRQYRFHVYNRWGKIVWFSDNVHQHWDGTIDGQPADIGVYFYLLEYRDPLNEKQSHTGEVHLIR